MKLTKIARIASISLCVLGMTSIASAIAMTVAPDGTVSYSGSEREAWLKSATSGFTFTANPSATDVGNLFGDSWTNEGELVNNGSNELLSINLLSGSWGESPVSGTWAIDSSFWLTYGHAVISMHVGNGQGDPDAFLWKITPNATNGSFYYKDLDGRGGGLSNLKLWGSGKPVEVPEGGLSAILLGLGLISLALFRRKLV